MQNNFEKQVQQKMEELRFSPPGPVWQNIEEAIKKKKDKRRFLLWLPLLFLLTGGLIWQVTNTKKAHHLSAFTKVKTKQKQEFTSKQTSNSSDHTITRHGNLQPVQEPISLNMVNPSASISKQHLHRSYFKKTTPVFQINEQKELNDKEKTQGAITQVAADKPVFKSISDTASKKPEVSIAKTQKPDSATTNGAVVKTKPTKQKWQSGFSILGGASGLSNGNLFGGSKSVNAYNRNVGTTALPVYAYPSEQKTSFSFSAGFTAQKKVSQKLSFSTGLIYAYYSNELTIGNEVKQDTTITTATGQVNATKYYTNANSNNYHNKYHFISVPLTLEYQPLQAMPLQVQFGISIQQLISTHALIYSGSSNIYYEDQNAYHKTQLFTHLGLSYSVFHTKKLNLTLGPKVQYGMSNLFKGESDKKHLYTVGIQTQITFPR